MMNTKESTQKLTGNLEGTSKDDESKSLESRQLSQVVDKKLTGNLEGTPKDDERRFPSRESPLKWLIKSSRGRSLM